MSKGRNVETLNGQTEGIGQMEMGWCAAKRPSHGGGAVAARSEKRGRANRPSRSNAAIERDGGSIGGRSGPSPMGWGNWNGMVCCDDAKPRGRGDFASIGVRQWVRGVKTGKGEKGDCGITVQSRWAAWQSVQDLAICLNWAERREGSGLPEARAVSITCARSASALRRAAKSGGSAAVRSPAAR